MLASPIGAGLYGVSKLLGASENTANMLGAGGSFVEVVGGVATGGGMLRKQSIMPAPIEGVNGNSKLSPRTTYLYKLYMNDGTFLKNGITQNLDTRYSKTYMLDKRIFPIASGTRPEMLTLERQNTLSNPGPLNYESWAIKAKNARGVQ
jgi:hypothetical protein